MSDNLSIVNHPATRLPGPALLHLLVQTGSENRRLAIDYLASDDSRVSLSYAEFHHASETLASRISALAGPLPGSEQFVVPVLIPQGPQLYIALLAILKAGGAFCPMNLDVPPERAKFILDDVSAKIVVTTSDLASKLPSGGQSVLLVDGEDLDEVPAATDHRQPNPTDLAYVMYTSGSTGTPKGVGVSHSAATQSLLAHDRHIPPFSRFLQFAAPTFDVSVFEIFFPLFRGQTLVSCTRPALLNDLPGVIGRMDVDACELTPSVAGSLLRKRENAPGLRLLLTIGEMLTQPVVDEFGGDEDRASMLWGMYGPTEAAIHCTVQPAFASGSAVRNIGIPLDTVSAFILGILDGHGAAAEFKVLARGEVGELAVGGHQLADCYLNRPEQTSSAFVDTPYGLLYRTGDKARMLADGTLECLGRISEGQVKLRGQRMELGEVEHAALRTSGCHSAIAAITDGTLVLFGAVDGSGGMDVAILDSCKQWLPGFMIPGDIVTVESFPRLASGKVDRKQLVADYKARIEARIQPVPYNDELEERLCELASANLGIAIHPTQDLSRTGLDSLSAIRLASALRAAGFEVGAVDLLEARSISALCSRLRHCTASLLARAPEVDAVIELAPSDIMASNSGPSDLGWPVEAVIPCTALQASMLAETMADPRAYCNWIELRFPGLQEHESVRAWILQLAKENEILRTGFIHHEGRFLQVIFEYLDESNVSVTDSFVREFEIRHDRDLLSPFRAQISHSPDCADTAVVLQIHHAVYDGWSMDLLLSDLGRLAQAQDLNPRPQFRRLSAYYSPVAFTDACDAAREFWAENLLGFQSPALPILSPELDKAPTVLSSTISFDISPGELRTALHSIGCGPQTIFQAALAWLWSAMVGSEDVVVGVIQSGRALPISRIEDIVGPCIASVPLRTDLSQVRTIKDLIVSIQAGNRATLPHSILPLSEIRRVAGLRPGQSIYDVLFIYQESLSGKDKNSNVVIEVDHQDHLETKLLMEVEPKDEGFDCRFTHHSEVFPESQIGIMAKSIRSLVTYMLSHLDSEVPSLRQAFPPLVLSIFNSEPKTFTAVPDLAHAVERTAIEFPDKDAVCFADHISDGVLTTTTITFAELNTTADRIAGHLSQQGVREGGVVAIVMEKSIRLYAGILAILKAGCAYLPLLPSTPVARIETILQQAKVDICLADTATRSNLEGRVPAQFVDVEALDLQSWAPPRAKPHPNPGRAAYIIYTSGSTGVPKGVCVTQLNIVSNLDVLSRIYPVRENSRLLQSCSQAFDVSVFDIFFSWTQGMCLCSATNDTLFEDLERSIRKLKVTHLSMAPTVAALADPVKVPRVEFLVTAGEAMTEVVAQKWGEKLFQGYGPSETTNICSVKRMGSKQAIQHLGWSFENTSTFVLSQDSTDIVPMGCLGEFCFGGDQVAQGYLNMEELTSAKFFQHPTFGRMYRSGDLGCMLPDGSMVITGRADEQIKIRGQRVELAEITATIRESEDVVDCATLLVRGAGPGSPDKIISFVVPQQHEGTQFRVLDLEDGQRLHIQSLYQALDSRLPNYMIPSAIVPISITPTTASGKLDRARLKDAFLGLGHDRLALVSQGAHVETDEGDWSDAESQVADAVSDALRVDRREIQRWMPLSTLGLDSISAIQVSKHLHTRLGRRFPISLILRNATVARLARELPELGLRDPTEAPGTAELLSKDLVENAAEKLNRNGKSFTKIHPCTPLQEAMLATSAGKGQYLNRMLFRVNGDLARFKEAWAVMCSRHDILRTCFLTTEDAQRPILQVVLGHWEAPWHEFGGSGLTVEDCIAQHAQGLSNAVDSMVPVISFATLTQNDTIYFSFVCHHALYDGVAIERLLFEVEQHLSGSALSPPPAYDQFLVESLTAIPPADSFWSTHLAGHEPKLMAHLVSELAAAESSPLKLEVDMPLSQIRARARELGVSLLALAQTAWATALGSLFRTTDICFGNVVNGRSLPIEGINELVAPCFNTIPVRMDLSRSRRNLDLMKAFQGLNAEVMQYQFTALRRIQSLFSPTRPRPLFDTLLLLQRSPRNLDQSLWTLERDEGEMDVISTRVQRHTTIYQLGFDSISAIQIAALLRKAGYQVLASDVIEHPTCEALAQHIDAQRGGSESLATYDLAKFQAEVQPHVSAQGIAADAIDAVLPCTPLQSAMMAQFLRSGGRDYFNYIDFELDSGVSSAMLTAAWGAVSTVHPILRTTIVPVEHDDCAFAMVQCPSALIERAAIVVPQQEAEKFNIKGWRHDAARAASQAPHHKLWSVAIIEASDKITMHLAIHHALYDAHSLQSVLEDLAGALKGNSIPANPKLGEAVATILEYTTADRTTQNSAEFWTRQADKVVINAFPVLTPLRETSRSILTQSTTSTAGMTALVEAASRSGHTLQAILQAAWTRVLATYLGEDSVVFGVVLSGRNTETTRDAVFPCISTLPVIASNAVSNQEMLSQMLRYNTELFKQQHQPLTRVQNWLGCPDSRLFDTLLVYQKFDLEEAGARPWRIVDEIASVDYPVSIEVEPKSGDLLGYQITFFSDALSEEQALLLLRQFGAQVEHLALHPSAREADLFTACPDLYSVLPPETPEIPTTVRFLHQFVELQALKTPESTALHFVESFNDDEPVGRKWTYRELDTNGNKVATLLLPHSKPGGIVAVYFDKCPEAYFSILGILKAGCAFVALDPGAPPLRNEFILQDSGASALVASKQRDEFGFTVSVPVIVISEDTLNITPAGPPVLARELDPNDVCYCLYTSGTTGTPKGCEITHDNAVQCMLAFQDIFQGHWQVDSKWLQFASLHFDVSVLEQYWSWSVGITLVAAPRDLILGDLAGTISRLGITHIDLTPSLARLLHPDDVPSLCRGVFITGGESLKQEILDVWGEKGVIYNFYGPTEATIGVTVFPRVPVTGRASNIGRQFINVGSYVFKPGTEQPVLRGGVGELCVSGRLVGKGYLKHEELTSERFPTLRQFGERVYRTGDLVRVLHDGCFDFLGRADDQVKLRGQRLEIGEINHVIRRGVDAVRDVATLVVRNEAQHKDFLVSFIVADGETKRRGQPSSLEIVEGPAAFTFCRSARDACRSKLPGYMVPTYVVQLSFIPLSSNNKAELKQLRKFFASLGQDRLMSLAAPPEPSLLRLSATGLRIARVLASMQGVDINSFTASASIFELGIDSISVLRFCRSLKNEGFMQATPSLVLQHPIIHELIGALDARTGRSGSDPVATARQLVQACAHKYQSHVCGELGVPPDQIEYIAPCSPLQQGMLSRSATESAYFNTFQLVLAPEVSSRPLQIALQRVIDHSPILRSRFVGTADGFVQVALRNVSLPWSEVQLSTKSLVKDTIRAARESWISRNLEHPIQQPLEALVLTSEGSVILVLHIFHALYDANSLDLVLDQVAGEYHALSGDPTHEHFNFTPAPSFLDALCFGPLQDFADSKMFWLEHFQDTTLHSRRSHLPTSGAATAADRTVSFTDLETLRTRLGVNHQALVQAAWVSVLATHISADPTIGIIISGRHIELDGAEKVLPHPTWASLVRQCHNFNTAVLPFQHVPLRDVQKWCSRGKPLFDTLFSFQREDLRGNEPETLWRVQDPEPSADYPLALEATLTSGGQLQFLLVAQGDSLTLSDMMDGLEQCLEAMAKDPDGPVLHAGKGVSEAMHNGHMTNGTTANGNSPELHHTSKFKWTEQATIIREEVATLAETEPDAVTETTPLFGLGLDSIDVIKLSARLKRRGISIKTSVLMKAQTISAMLELNQEQGLHRETNGFHSAIRGRGAAEVASALQKHLDGLGELDEHDVVLPATPLQESMIVEMLESGCQLYFNHDILELDPSVDTQRLKDAWRTVISGSPILRTRLLPLTSPVLNASFAQVISPDSSVYLNEVKLDGTDELVKICTTATLRAHKGAGRSNLLQLVFASVGSQRFLVLSIAHALYDGWSLGLILQDVEAAYSGRYCPRGLEAYVREVEDMLSPGQQDSSSFWSGFLQHAPPTIFPKNDIRSSQMHLIHRDEVASALSAPEITSFCRAHAMTLQTLGQACWAALLAAKTRSLDVTFGVVLSCRDTESLEDLVFPTMNTVAVRSILHGSISSWLRYIQDNMTNIRSHQHFPLREAQRLAKSNGQLFNTLFIQQRGVSTDNRPGSSSLMRSVGGTSAVEYPVCVEVELTGNDLVWRIACDGAYASQENTSRMLQELDNIMWHVIRSPAADVLRFSGPEVSICGLPPTIRDALAVVSGVPPATILKSNNIYHLGLDSISAIKVVSLLRRKGVALGFRDMLKAGSIAEMAQRVSEPAPAPSTANGEDGGTRLLSIPGDIDVPAALRGAGINESTVEEVLPATSMQVHMLSVWQNTRGKVFHPCFKYTLSGPTDVNIVEAAWHDLVAENPILRTVFVSTNSHSTPVLQVVVAPSALGRPSPSADGTVWSSTPSGASQPYRSLRAEKTDEGRWSLQLRIHHALYDAVSLPAIMDRFAWLCGPGKTETSALPRYNLSKAISSSRSEDAQVARKQFWTEYLEGAESISSRPETDEQHTNSRVGLVQRRALQHVPAITEACRARGVSVQALFFAAYARLLASSGGSGGNGNQRRVVFGVYLANRDEGDEAGTNVYPLLRLVPLCVMLREGTGLFEIAAKIQKDIHAISSAVNVEVGLWEVKDWTGITVDSFVNFLGVGSDVSKGKAKGVRLEVVEALEKDSSSISDSSSESGDGQGTWSMPELASNPVRDAFPDAIDVEVSVQRDEMTLGVFGSGTKLGSNGAAGIIDGVVALLKGGVDL
ncbi:hypothetical protein C8A05DRAFT_14464 [Staphylotrichum tortipilum]|uniref:Carrier domain-containing protein n=1 Tax=Staphylotrichum tortipilum TaxID=2831512 RepID=A0AAN6MMC7_9PEZI|nr:hypothetical protein C8A05DRAFT_14464 [Staphylotrichum longicolle]